MKLNFCVVCGTKDDLQQHHITPVIRSRTKSYSKNKKYDPNKPLKDCDTYEIFGYLFDQGYISDDGEITVCAFHHHIIHGIVKYQKTLHSNMVKEGQENARKQGKQIGRPSNINDDMVLAAKIERENGLGIKNIAKKLKIGVGTVYKLLEQDHIITSVHEEFDDITGTIL